MITSLYCQKPNKRQSIKLEDNQDGRLMILNFAWNRIGSFEFNSAF